MQSGAARSDAHAAGSRGAQRAPVLDLSPRRAYALSATSPPVIRTMFGGSPLPGGMLADLFAAGAPAPAKPAAPTRHQNRQRGEPERGASSESGSIRGSIFEPASLRTNRMKLPPAFKDTARHSRDGAKVPDSSGRQTAQR